MAEQVRNPSNRKAGKGSQRTGARTNGDADGGAAGVAGSGAGGGDATAGPLRPRGGREEGSHRRWRAESLLQDVRFALRTLRKSWGFTLTAVLTLALGIGANTAIFQLLDAVRLRSLPVSDPGSLAGVQVKNGNRGFGITIADDETSLTYPLWEQIRLHQQVFSKVFGWADSGSATLGEGAQMRRARGLWVSGDAFATLGLNPERGHFFSSEDDTPRCGLPGVVISYGLWQSEFGGRDSAIGGKLIVNGLYSEVIGVTPRSFFGLEVGKTFDFAVPFCSVETYFPGSGTMERTDYFWLHVLGRLKPGINLQRASSEMAAMSPGIIEATLPTGYGAPALEVYRHFELAAAPGGNGISMLRQTYDTSLRLLLVITALVLLIACANLGNLMLARASTRDREMAVRLALGASRWRLVRQLLSEGLLLAASGAVLGMALAEIFSRSLIRFLSMDGAAIRLDLSLDWRVLGFTGLIAVLTCLVFGLVPAVRSSGTSPGAVLKSGSRGTTAGQERFSFQRLLVVSQLAVSVVLLVGALLFVQSFRNLATIDPGFRVPGILITTVDFRRMELTPERVPAHIRELLTQIRSLPQVESAATSTHILLNGSSWNLGVRISGREGSAKFTWVSPDYFRTLGIPLLTGRDFDERDTRTSPRVAVVNEAFAERYLSGQNPIGKVLRTNSEPGFPEAEYEIVGLIKNTKYDSLREPSPPMTFGAAEQDPSGAPWTALFIRSRAPAATVISALRAKLSAINPTMTVEFHVLETDIRNGLMRERLMAVLSGFFGALAGLLAMIGLYGLISYTVATRKNEIGIRMALGATSGSVTRIIVRQTLTMLGVGIGGGLVLSMAAANGANSLLYGLQANDPVTLLGAAGFLTVVALVASYVPAYRASRVDPMNALRYE